MGHNIPQQVKMSGNEPPGAANNCNEPKWFIFSQNTPQLHLASLKNDEILKYNEKIY